MSDLISKQGWECQNRLVYIKRHVDKRLEAQAAEIERLSNPWVSVDDALPTEEGRYITTRNKEFDSPSITLWLNDGLGFGKTITHWMPIPPRGDT
jgi:hypothetical protein